MVFDIGLSLFTSHLLLFIVFAIQCCVCGGGHSSEYIEDSATELQQAVEASQTQACWDEPNFYDSTGDGCLWYASDEHNCEYFGDQFPSDIDGQTANDAVSKGNLISDAIAVLFCMLSFILYHGSCLF